MIDATTFYRIKNLAERDGLNAVQIAEQLQLSPPTVRKWLAREQFEKPERKRRERIIDPYKPLIHRLVERYEYSGRQIFRILCEEGYGGGYTAVTDFLRTIRPPRKTAFLTLAFAPGECAQIDWGPAGVMQLGEVRRRVSFFVMVLCYSRMLYVEFTLKQAMEHFLSCQRHALEFFGGVPLKVMVDNCKTAVLKRPRGEPAELNPRYADFARHYRFEIVPCNVRAAHEKGRVENAIGYVKKNLLNGLELSSLTGLQLAADNWRDQVANVRIHGTTGKRPVDLFEQEKKQLQPLPLNPYDCGVSHRSCSNSQFRVAFETNRYSVPAQYASTRPLTLRVYPDTICIYRDGELIAEHKRCYERRRNFEHPDHPKPLLAQRAKARDQHLMRRFVALGPIAETFYHGLRERRLNPITHVRRILALVDIYDEDNVTAAMTDAAEFRAFSSECITNLLEQRARGRSEAAPLHLPRNQDLLEIDLDQPDLDIYTENDEEQDNESNQ
jgi:transposase